MVLIHLLRSRTQHGRSERVLIEQLHFDQVLIVIVSRVDLLVFVAQEIRVFLPLRNGRRRRGGLRRYRRQHVDDFVPVHCGQQARDCIVANLRVLGQLWGGALWVRDLLEVARRFVDALGTG